MTHRSRLCAVLFDVEGKDFEDATRFWAAALQRDTQRDSDGRYATLPGEVDVLVQSAIPGREGMHVDIETDDVDAEVSRLEKLGASKREQVKDWWVMTAPDGQPFCVVPVQSKNWPAGSVEWES